MCYSSQIESAYHRYLRETGAGMDLDQFTEVHDFSAVDSTVDIPRAVERWFDAHDSDAARRIAALISRRIATAKIEQSLRRLPLSQRKAPTALDDRILPFHYAPIVIEENGCRVPRLARYHCRQVHQPASIDRERERPYYEHQVLAA